MAIRCIIMASPGPWEQVFFFFLGGGGDRGNKGEFFYDPLPQNVPKGSEEVKTWAPRQ